VILDWTYDGHTKYILISSNEVVETCAWRSNTLSLIVTLTSYLPHKNGVMNIKKVDFCYVISIHKVTISVNLIYKRMI